MSTRATIEAMPTIRTLTSDDASLLGQAPDALVPNLAMVTGVVEERDGILLGRRFLCLVPHVEGAWQRPECDVPALESALAAHIQSLGISGAMRAAPIHEDLSAFGYEPLPLLLWVKR